MSVKKETRFFTFFGAQLSLRELEDKQQMTLHFTYNCGMFREKKTPKQ